MLMLVLVFVLVVYIGCMYVASIFRKETENGERSGGDGDGLIND